MIRIAKNEFDYDKVITVMKQLNWKWDGLKISKEIIESYLDLLILRHIKPAYIRGEKDYSVEQRGLRLELNKVNSDSKDVKDCYDFHILFILERAVANENEAIRNLINLD